MPIVAVQSLSQVRILGLVSRDYTPPVFSAHGVPQARILEWAAISFSRDLPKLGINLTFLALAGRLFTTEPPEKPFVMPISTVINIFRNDMPSQLQI